MRSVHTYQQSHLLWISFINRKHIYKIYINYVIMIIYISKQKPSTTAKHPLPSNLQYKLHLCRQWNCWSLRCSWSIACRRCPNYIFILDLMPGFNRLHKDNSMTRRETFQFWNLVHLILETWRYIDGWAKDCGDYCSLALSHLYIIGVISSNMKSFNKFDA